MPQRDCISVIIPIYNVEKYLDRCLRSLLDQTYQNFEVIMVDDCSSDRSREIAQSYTLLDHRFSLLVNRENQGSAGSRNAGIRSAQGDWLFFVDSDDWIREDALQLLINDADQNKSDVVMCGYYYAWDDGRIKEIDSFSHLTTASAQREILALVPQPSTTRRLYRTSFFRSVGFDFPETVQRGEDFPLAIPLLTYTDRISILNEPLYYYYQRKGSKSNSNKIIDFGFYDEIKRITDERVKKGFEQEIEYKYILEFVYARTMLMIYSDCSNQEIDDKLKQFNWLYPNWVNNPYIKKTAVLKRIFLYLAYKRQFNILRLLIKLKDRLLMRM